MSDQYNVYQSSEVVTASGSQSKDKNSKIGTASFVLSSIGVVGAIIIVGYLVYLDASGQRDLQLGELRAIWLGLGVLLCLAILLMSFVLGVIGLFQSEFRRTLAILGTSMSTIVILLMVGMVWLGLRVD